MEEACCGGMPPYTLHPTPYTLHPTPYTLHPTPYTLRPTPYALHPTPHTLNWEGVGPAGGEEGIVRSAHDQLGHFEGDVVVR